jgi:hypothetical protein
MERGEGQNTDRLPNMKFLCEWLPEIKQPMPNKIDFGLNIQINMHGQKSLSALDLMILVIFYV